MVDLLGLLQTDLLRRPNASLVVPFQHLVVDTVLALWSPKEQNATVIVGLKDSFELLDLFRELVPHGLSCGVVGDFNVISHNDVCTATSKLGCYTEGLDAGCV